MARKPRITISSLDLERLEHLLDNVDESPASIALEDELARARVVEPGKMPNNVVTMNSTVRFKVSSSNKEFCLTLVYPKDMKDPKETVSVLAPVGSALLGLSVGSEIQWPTPDGKSSVVHIDEISYQPERAGDLHR